MHTISLPTWARQKFDEWFEIYPNYKPQKAQFFAQNNQRIYTRYQCKAVGSLVSPNKEESIILHYVFPGVEIKHEVI